MRDPNRIPKFLGKLQGFWLKHPDLRFGQIISLLEHATDDQDLSIVKNFFYAEEIDWEKAIEVLSKKK